MYSMIVRNLMLGLCYRQGGSLGYRNADTILAPLLLADWTAKQGAIEDPEEVVITSLGSVEVKEVFAESRSCLLIDYIDTEEDQMYIYRYRVV